MHWCNTPFRAADPSSQKNVVGTASGREPRGMMRGAVIATASVAVALSRQWAHGLSQHAAMRQFERALPSSVEHSALALADASARGSFKAISSVGGESFARPEQRKRSVTRFFLPGLIW